MPDGRRSPGRPRIVVLSQRYSVQHYVALVSAASEIGADVAFAELTPVRETLKALRSRSLRPIPAVWRRFARALGLLRTRGRDADVVVVGLAPYDWRMVAAGRLDRTRPVYFTSWPHWDPAAGRWPARRLARTRAVQAGWDRFMGRVAAVATVTPCAAAALTSRFACAPAPVVVGHTVADCFYEAAAERAARRRPGGAAPAVLYVGRLERSKGIDRVVELAGRLGREKAEFTVVGRGSQSALVERAAAAGTLRYAGARPSEQVAATMADCDVLVAPGRRTATWEEVFGMAIAEGAAAGLHVVATDHAGPRWLSELSPRISLVEDGDDEDVIDAIAARIDDLRTDPGRSDDAAPGAASGLGRFRAERVREAWETVVRQALDRAVPGP